MYISIQVYICLGDHTLLMTIDVGKPCSLVRSWTCWTWMAIASSFWSTPTAGYGRDLAEGSHEIRKGWCSFPRSQAQWYLQEMDGVVISEWSHGVREYVCHRSVSQYGPPSAGDTKNDLIKKVRMNCGTTLFSASQAWVTTGSRHWLVSWEWHGMAAE